MKISGCSFQCLDDHCNLAQVSESKALCQTILRTAGKNLYYFQENTTVSISTNVILHLSHGLTGLCKN